MLDKYDALDLRGQKGYVRSNRRSQLREADAVVFDCDGTLIDITDSYNRAISRTVTYILEALIGHSISEDLASNNVAFSFRKSGGFNNDWDTVYGILMFVLCSLPSKNFVEIGERVRKSGPRSDPFDRLSAAKIAGACRELSFPSKEFFQELTDRLRKFTRLLDATGVDSVDRNLMRGLQTERCQESYRILKDFFFGRGDVGDGIVATAFEEFFCGSELFMRTYGIKPRFHDGPGKIENERVIVLPETIDELVSMFGRSNIGIASGSGIGPAKYVLKGILDHFPQQNLVFLDDVERAERELSNRSDLKANLKKPNPFSLFRASKVFFPFKYALCVGDSAEDLMMVKEAIKTDPRFLSAGVYQYSYPKDEIIRNFLELECDLVLPSVNELPLALKRIGAVRK